MSINLTGLIRESADVSVELLEQSTRLLTAIEHANELQMQVTQQKQVVAGYRNEVELETASLRSEQEVLLQLAKKNKDKPLPTSLRLTAGDKETRDQQFQQFLGELVRNERDHPYSAATIALQAEERRLQLLQSELAQADRTVSGIENALMAMRVRIENLNAILHAVSLAQSVTPEGRQA